MITPHRLPLHVRSNDRPWRHRINIYGDDGEPVDMRGYHGKMQVRWYEGQPDDPIAGLSRAFASTHSDGSPFSDGSFYVSTDSLDGSRIVFDETGLEITITHLDLLRFPPGMPNMPVLRFSYDILVAKDYPEDILYSPDLPDYDLNAWFEGPLDFHYGVTDPEYERRSCPIVYDDFPDEYHQECRRRTPEACGQYGCLWFKMPTNVPTSVLRAAIWPDAASG